MNEIVNSYIYLRFKADRDSYHKLSYSKIPSYNEIEECNEEDFRCKLVDEENKIYEYQLLFEVYWTGDWEELKRMTHHAEGLYEGLNIEDFHFECYILDENKWYGGNEHNEFELPPYIGERGK